MTPLAVPSIHLITSRRRTNPDARTLRDELIAVESLIDQAVEGGVDVVQVRERDLDTATLYGLVTRIVARAAGTGTVVLVNDRADVAAAARAAGVHVPSDGMPIDRVRTIEPCWIVGRSIHRDDQPADRVAADYLLFGTVFPSESKAADHVTAGLEGLRDAVQRVGRPVVAIGGVTPDRARLCVETGAAGVAAIGAFLPPGPGRAGALGPRAAVAAFRAALAGSADAGSDGS